MPQPAATAAPRHPPPGFGPQPMAQGGMVAGAMTAEQLEAQMISKAREQQQQQQQHAPAAGGDKGLLALLKGGAAAGPGAGAGPIAAPSPQQMQQRPPFGMPLPPGGPPTGPPTGPPVSQAQPMQQPPPPSFPQQPPPPWAAPGGMPHPPPHMASMPPNGGFPPGGIRPPHLDVQGRMQPHGVPGGMPGFPYPPPPHLRGPYGLGERGGQLDEEAQEHWEQWRLPIVHFTRLCWHGVEHLKAMLAVSLNIKLAVWQLCMGMRAKSMP